MGLLKFELLKTVGQARRGRMHLPHGVVETPTFMPVGTNANVKLVTPHILKENDVQIILSNAFHLYLKPGLDVIRDFGGLHNFMNWDRPILTDSGGFQVFSLKKGQKITDDGVWIMSPLDGSKHFITPELSMEIQATLGSDIVMAFDYCADPKDGYEESKKSVKLTTKWAKRSLEHLRRISHQALFGIIQGAIYEDLREQSLSDITQYDFDGFAIGGLSVGEPREVTMKIVEFTAPKMPYDKPRYFMGGGSPDLLVDLVANGVDIFDSVFPTRVARHGLAVTWNGKFNIRSARYKYDKTPIDENCTCYTCRNFSKGYLRHLFDREEVLGQILLTIHDVHFMMEFGKKMRESIENGTFEVFRERVKKAYEKKDNTNN
ncbi:tRNA guanosine(34) transglycosylase Tgt [Fervidobacterium riparium]|uniref:Queuine tRNA-ribosyltransferase n=1 Tax=Fervidobacterium gondwanense DSM 13020 TaxID=1121883 RepID=A0A1M7T8Z5_FERGO|nr:tRNA guanosine(34) transglycosylase Tgt [Fervidobacterium gondwanense]UXF01323.1 queuine tRNA-ribosyltransferase [Fervidobacterium riparium]SHN67141.1 tRNA-guanine transglycosylase [Fervidobacterium gondwanense DSM 13020]